MSVSPTDFPPTAFAQWIPPSTTVSKGFSILFKPPQLPTKPLILPKLEQGKVTRGVQQILPCQVERVEDENGAGDEKGKFQKERLPVKMILFQVRMILLLAFPDS